MPFTAALLVMAVFVAFNSVLFQGYFSWLMPFIRWRCTNSPASACLAPVSRPNPAFGPLVSEFVNGIPCTPDRLQYVPRVLSPDYR